MEDDESTVVILKTEGGMNAAADTDELIKEVVDDVVDTDVDAGAETDTPPLHPKPASKL